MTPGRIFCGKSNVEKYLTISFLLILNMFNDVRMYTMFIFVN